MNRNANNSILRVGRYACKQLLFSLSPLICFLFLSTSINAQCNLDGGTLSTSDPTHICAGDGIGDPIHVEVNDASVAEFSGWVITDTKGNILGIPPGPPFDLEGAGAGTCVIWYMVIEGAVVGVEVGLNIEDLEGCYAFSTPITVERDGVTAVEISTSSSTSICAGDGNNDFVDVSISGNGENGRWVITDPVGNILGLPAKPPFNFEEAGQGTCYIWYMTSPGKVDLFAGENVYDVSDCFALSNSIIVERSGVDGGHITTSGNRYICAGDGSDDLVDASVENNVGENSAWIITSESGDILGLPAGPPFNFEGAGTGICIIWHISYNGDLSGAELGANTANLQGCYDFSNSVKVVRRGVEGGEIGTSDATSFCVGDGSPNYVTPELTGGVGAFSVWIVTDSDGNILAFPKKFPINFEGAGAGVCQIWHLNYLFGLKGIGIGNNIADLKGCYAFSNPITINRNASTGLVSGGTISTNDPTTICAGDGSPDPIDVTLSGAQGANMSWVITDSNGNILGLPPGPPFDLDGAGAGTCLIWNLSYEDGLTGVEVGANTSNLEGCFALSNSITVTRQEASGGIITALTGRVFNRAVIANRASGTISVINTDDNTLERDYAMPDDGQPMYVVYNSDNNTVIVGDYNGHVVIFDGKDFSVKGSVEAGAGVFHMWLSPDNQQLWVNNELDKTISVINPNTMTNLSTFSIPKDLIDAGYKPHDVIIMPDNSAAFVTMLGPLDEDYVVKYDAQSFEEIGRTAVGPDPHVSLTSANSYLYVASQGSGEVAVLNRSDLTEVSVLSVPNAHGLGMNHDGSYLYVGNISEGGTNANYTIDLSSNTLMGNPVNAPFAAPHNYAVTGDDAKLFVTHSGATNNKVSIYSLDPTPTLMTSLTVGNNPFGLATYSYTETVTDLSICAGDGMSDAFDVTLSGNVGSNSHWVITDSNGNILGLPSAPPFDLEGAGAGTCLVWHLSAELGLEGLVVGENTADLEGCYSLSNPITVTRTEPTAGLSGGSISTTNETNICAGDGTPDFIFVDLEDEAGPNMAWVITDIDLNILALPAAPPFNLDGAGAGVCLIWHLSFDNGLSGAEVGMNAGDLQGCYSLSNSITVNRTGVEGGMLLFADGSSAYTICAGDGMADPLDISLSGEVGETSAWVITNESFEILGLPAGPPFDLEGAGAGTCLLWHLSYNGTITGAEMGQNALLIDGCHSLSNAISVTRIGSQGPLEGGTISTKDPTSICAGDGQGDPINVNVDGAVGTNSGWVITDPDLNILGIPAGPPFDLEGAGAGTCLIWHISFEDGLSGVIVGQNAADMQGCYALSNSIVVTRTGVAGGTLTLQSGSQDTSICAGDGVPDPLEVIVTGATGTNAAWVITNQAGEILGLPTGPPFDLDGAGAGTCLIWYMRSEGDVNGVEVGLNAMNFEGCYDLSNPITVVRTTVGGPCDQSPLESPIVNRSFLNVQLFPNPASGVLNINLQTEIKAPFKIDFFDASGRKVKTSKFESIRNGEMIQQDVSDLNNGFYFLKITSEKHQETISFVIEK